MQQFLVSAALVCAAMQIATAQTAAVIPFFNPSPSRNLDWIGESIAEVIREALGSRGVLTLDRSDLREASDRLGLRVQTVISDASVIKIGESLDAEYVIFGSYRFTPAPPISAAATAASPPPASRALVSRGSLRVAARVVDLRHMRQSPEFVETGALEDLAVLEAHLAWRALAAVAPNLAPPESEFRGMRAALRLDAQENYVRGLLASPDQQEKYFLQAARLDARFVQPAFQLGRIYSQRKEYRRAITWLEKVPSGAIHFREACFLLGLARFESGDYAGAQKAFQTIVATVPLGEVYNNQGAAENRRSLPQAVESFRKAVETDPNDPVYRFNTGYALWKRGEFNSAAVEFREVLERVPEDQLASLLLNRCLKKQALGTLRAEDARLQNLERLKTNYQERAYWQLKAVLEPKTP
ncbi:MAG TPA: tetratricopeptide repeat protein [Bryobacteraceae bacterium]|jgi:Tfp pilus assembly protein PilF|nr:tetratricopeptide repeat protein [Bryobacteraceae bacterium]